MCWMVLSGDSRDRRRPGERRGGGAAARARGWTGRGGDASVKIGYCMYSSRLHFFLFDACRTELLAVETACILLNCQCWMKAGTPSDRRALKVTALLDTIMANFVHRVNTSVQVNTHHCKVSLSCLDTWWGSLSRGSLKDPSLSLLCLFRTNKPC